MTTPALKKTLGPVMLWGLGVGYVISGEYFGWNLGLPAGGTYGMLAATLLVTVMYLAFTLSYAELACALPHAGGVFVYARRGLGPLAGLLAGIVQLVEFVFAPPAIAMAIGANIAQRYPGVDVKTLAIAAYLGFTALNAWGVRQAAWFELAVTVLAVLELSIFVAVVGPRFSFEAFSRDAWPAGYAGAFACLPFAIWLYLGIEGIANAAEESRNPRRDIPRSFIAAIVTLVVLALLVFFSAVGAAGWPAVVYVEGSTATSDAPLPLALARVVSREHVLFTLLVGMGVLGLVASFHGLILAASRATFDLGRAGYLPRKLGRISARTQTPVAALVVNMLVGIVAILSGKTAEIITLSCFGALGLYIIAMLSLFALRRREPGLARPYRAIGYPVLPALALALATLSLVALTYFNARTSLLFAGLIALGALYQALAGRRAS